MIPEHYSRDIAQRCHSLIRHVLPTIQQGLPDDTKFGGPLETTFLLAMATPMVVIPIERLHTPAEYPIQVGDDRALDPDLTDKVSSVFGADRKFCDTPFGAHGGWSYVPAYSPVFNLADGCPADLLNALGTEDSAQRARNAPTSVILRVLRNGLAHGGVAYLDGNGMNTDRQAAMFAFIATEKDTRRRVVGLNVLRVSQSDFCSYLTAWADWLAQSRASA